MYLATSGDAGIILFPLGVMLAVPYVVADVLVVLYIRLRRRKRWSIWLYALPLAGTFVAILLSLGTGFAALVFFARFKYGADILGFLLWLYVNLSMAFVFVAPFIAMPRSSGTSGDTNSSAPAKAQNSGKGRADTLLQGLAILGGTIWLMFSLAMLAILLEKGLWL